MVRDEKLINLADAVGEIPVHVSKWTVWQWSKKGVDGIMLETVKIGRRLFTSKEAIARFLDRVMVTNVKDDVPTIKA
jgi:hypothetical protein